MHMLFDMKSLARLVDPEKRVCIHHWIDWYVRRYPGKKHREYRHDIVDIVKTPIHGTTPLERFVVGFSHLMGDWLSSYT